MSTPATRGFACPPRRTGPRRHCRVRVSGHRMDHTEVGAVVEQVGDEAAARARCDSTLRPGRHAAKLGYYL